MNLIAHDKQALQPQSSTGARTGQVWRLAPAAYGRLERSEGIFAPCANLVGMSSDSTWGRDSDRGGSP